MDPEKIVTLGAAGIVDAIRRGETSAEGVAIAHLDRIADRQPLIRGWTKFYDVHDIRATAGALDTVPAEQRGPLHGVPFGIKDIIDTASLQTSWGSPIWSERTPERDAACVTLARQAGAVIFGKTVTTEFATFHAGPTRNPINPDHTPGGSSSGSAAVVADDQVPLAFGTQTIGSVNRPGAFCGVPAYKASVGQFSLSGVMSLAHSYDSLGWYGHTPADLALCWDALMGRRQASALEPLPGPARIALCAGPQVDHASPAALATLEAAAQALAQSGAAIITRPALPDLLGAAAEVQFKVFAFEAARNLAPELALAPEKISERFHAIVDIAKSVTVQEYLDLARTIRAMRAAFDAFAQDYDAVLTLPAPGEAPRFEEGTGDPIFNRLWTLLGVPSITLPAGRGPQKLPLAVMLVGRWNEDHALLRLAHALGPIVKRG